MGTTLSLPPRRDIGTHFLYPWSDAVPDRLLQRLSQKQKPFKSAPWSKPSFVVRARHRLKRSSCFRRQRLHYEATKKICQALTLRELHARSFHCGNRIVSPKLRNRFGDDLFALCLRVFRLGRHEEAVRGADK